MPALTSQQIAELQILLNTKDGVFQNLADTNNTVANTTFNDLSRALETERTRIHTTGRNISFEPIIINIDDLISKLDLITHEPINGSNFSHFEFLYGLEQTSSIPLSHRINLIMSGVKLNANDASVNPVSTNRFSFPNSPGDHTAKTELFKTVFAALHNNNFIRGAFIKTDVFRNRLTAFKTLTEGNCNSIQISFGFMKPLILPEGTTNPNNRNCFHLIIRGIMPNRSPSPNVFSTYDNDPGYSGPKPSTPPFNR